MTKMLSVISVFAAAILLCAGVSGNYAFAKPSVKDDSKTSMSASEKSKFVANAKALSDETRKKALEKIHKDSTTKKSDAKKQLALEAKAIADAKKKLVLYKTKVKK
ncbi:MAG: hypothetical protein HZC29_01755 [Thaumarchaeota archaeon]|nr:hypothetical protein [Nitrososphaerota archaeon]